MGSALAERYSAWMSGFVPIDEIRVSKSSAVSSACIRVDKMRSREQVESASIVEIRLPSI